MSKSCPKCGGRMGEGYVADADSGAYKISHWVEGAPVKGFFGVKVGRRKKLEVETWRCGRCAYLESYAPGP